MDLKYYENNLVEARLTFELVKEGAKVAIMRMCQARNIDADRIAQIGNAITKASGMVDYHEKKLVAAKIHIIRK